MSDCCPFIGDQLSCIDCHKTRHEYIVPVHAFPDHASIPKDFKNRAEPSTKLKAPPVPNKPARKEDEQKPAAMNKKVDDAITKLKEPAKPVNKEDTEDDRKLATKEDNKDKSNRRPPKLPTHFEVNRPVAKFNRQVP
jgi:hypothetical protein